jgi:hypothetical protein
LRVLVACDKSESQGTVPPAPGPAPTPAAQSEATQPHLDVSADKSGALARAAAVLEVEGIDNDDLRELSHHAETLPSAAAVCQHMVEVRGSTGGIKDCVADIEHHVVLLGPELYAAAADCFMKATTPAGLDACVAAEEEAEKLLHDAPHGEGLDRDACEGFFAKFDTLARADAGDEADHIGQVLATVKGDVVRSCMQHSTQAEMQCADKAKTLHELETCAENLV